MKLTNKLTIATFLSIFSLYSCSSESLISNNQINKSNINHKNLTITGTAEFDDFKQNNNFKIKAENSISTRATVSLMYASDYSNTSLQNTTIATGLSDEQGNFIINPEQNFVPEINNVMVLEASKRIGGAGNTKISLRTNIVWNGNSWQSISSSGIRINKQTTALSIISSLDNKIMNSAESINKLVYSNGVGQIIFNTKLTPSRFNTVYREVEKLLSDLRDPVEAIFFLSPYTGAVSYEYYRYINYTASNMHTIQTSLEIYAIDWNGIYPDTIEQLEQESKVKYYWRETKNPFRLYQPIPNYLPVNMNMSDYQQTKATLNYKGNTLNDKSDLKGIVVYQPVRYGNSPPTNYFVYGVDGYGDFIKNGIRHDEDIFVLSNY